MDNPRNVAIFDGLAKGKSYSVIIKELKEKGYTVSKANITKLNKKYVKLNQGLPLSPKKPRKKRGSYKYSKVQLDKLKSLVKKENSPSTRELVDKVKMKRGSIMYHIKNSLGFKLVKKPKVHHLTDKQAEVRKERAGKLIKFIERNWMHILVTDEKLFRLRSSSYQSPYQYLLKKFKRRDAKLYFKTRAHSKSVMVWAGICATGRTKLYFVKPGVKVNGQYYVDKILKPVFKNDWPKLFPNNDGIFQQDGAPGHTSKSTINYLDSLKINYIKPLEWTTNSPDNSACDYFLWGELERRVKKHNPKSIAGLQKVIMKDYSAIPQEQIYNALKS